MLMYQKALHFRQTGANEETQSVVSIPCHEEVCHVVASRQRSNGTKPKKAVTAAANSSWIGENYIGIVVLSSKVSSKVCETKSAVVLMSKVSTASGFWSTHEALMSI